MADENDGTGPKVVDLGSKNPTQAQLDKLRRDVPQIIEMAQLIAKVRRAAYLASIQEGFTELQALELCKNA